MIPNWYLITLCVFNINIQPCSSHYSTCDTLMWPTLVLATFQLYGLTRNYMHQSTCSISLPGIVFCHCTNGIWTGCSPPGVAVWSFSMTPKYVMSLLSVVYLLRKSFNSNQQAIVFWPNSIRLKRKMIQKQWKSTNFYN